MSSRLVGLFKRAFRKELEQAEEKDIPAKEELSEIFEDLNKVFQREEEEAGLFTTEVVLVQGLHYEALSLHRRFKTKYTQRLLNKITSLRSHTINKANYFRKIRELLKKIYLGAIMCRRFDQNIERLKQETDTEERKELFKSLEVVTAIMKQVREQEDKLAESIGVLRDDTKNMRNIIRSKDMKKALIDVRDLKPVIFKKIKRGLDHLDYILKKEQIRIPAINRKIRMLEKREKKVVSLLKEIAV